MKLCLTEPTRQIWTHIFQNNPYCLISFSDMAKSWADDLENMGPGQKSSCTPHLLFIVNVRIRRASAKLENSFVTANFASARAQRSKLERQRALLQNCGQIINRQQLFIFPNSLTIHQTPPLHNTFYFSNTWTKIQLRSDHVNMQPDETKCYPQRPITTLWPAACKMLSTSSGSPPLNSGTLSLHMERNCRIRRGAAGYWNVTLATTRRQALSWCSQANIRRRTGKMWWLIEICINWVVHWSFDGYH